MYFICFLLDEGDDFALRHLVALPEGDGDDVPVHGGDDLLHPVPGLYMADHLAGLDGRSHDRAAEASSTSTCHSSWPLTGA